MSDAGRPRETFTLGELISELQGIREEFGDVRVLVPDAEGGPGAPPVVSTFRLPSGERVLTIL